MKYLLKQAMIISIVSFASVSVANECQSQLVYGQGEANGNNTLARLRAKENWRDNAFQAYGSHYNNWIKAINQSFSCQITGKGIKKHTCIASAIPCKSIL